ncbi:hypothetical protein [Kitasatospora cheerisanensis]|uniref:DUF3592 domain-containing protein n=1 Tax=Kitasatospora cheerisanensis KCTC 2395 TaxID=1348663 RepID=A0A066YPT3_9ACTN|nr:hypothetical protein [Kitasatospora cheerisanensis]KDN81999.1 hypothetical protein KCH_61530 [Kitasatospora cheerisanensis KCTC 2395]
MISESSPSAVPSVVLRGGGRVARFAGGLVVVEERGAHHRIPLTAIEAVEDDGTGTVRLRLAAGSGPVGEFVIRQRRAEAARAFARAVSASLPGADGSGRVESVPVVRSGVLPRQLARAAAAWAGAGSFLRAAAVAIGVWAVVLLLLLVLRIGRDVGNALAWLPALPLLLAVVAGAGDPGVPYLWLRWVLWRRGISVMAAVEQVRITYGYRGRRTRHAVYAFVDAEGRPRTATDRHTEVRFDRGTFEIAFDPRRPSRVLLRGSQGENVYGACVLVLVAAAAGSAAAFLALAAAGVVGG